MSQSRTNKYQDTRVDVKIVLSGLWVSMLLVFAYVDIFGFWRADVINGALTSEVPGTDFKVNQAFLALTTIYILIPILMVVVSLLARPTVSRPINIVVSLLYLATVAASSIGEEWLYYLLGSVVEGILLLGIARVAWAWPRTSDASIATSESGRTGNESIGGELRRTRRRPHEFGTEGAPGNPPLAGEVAASGGILRAR